MPQQATSAVESATATPYRMLGSIHYAHHALEHTLLYAWTPGTGFETERPAPRP